MPILIGCRGNRWSVLQRPSSVHIIPGFRHSHLALSSYKGSLLGAVPWRLLTGVTCSRYDVAVCMDLASIALVSAIALAFQHGSSSIRG